MSDSPRVSTSMPLASWLERLGRSNGAPGGGAASAITLGVSAALLRMVAGYSPEDSRAAECRRLLAELRLEALEGSEEDGVRSARLGAALALGSDDPVRDERVFEAAMDAARSTAELGELAASLADVLRLLAEIGNRALAVDLAVAAQTLAAGTSAASITLRSDLALARDHGGHETQEPIRALAAAADRLSAVQRDVETIAADLSAPFLPG